MTSGLRRAELLAAQRGGASLLGNRTAPLLSEFFDYPPDVLSDSITRYWIKGQRCTSRGAQDPPFTHYGRQGLFGFRARAIF
jgi:hypothetical protein